MGLTRNRLTVDVLCHYFDWRLAFKFSLKPQPDAEYDDRNQCECHWVTEAVDHGAKECNSSPLSDNQTEREKRDCRAARPGLVRWRVFVACYALSKNRIHR